MSNVNRREFVKLTAATGLGASSLLASPLTAAPIRSGSKLKLLILGGTGFLGPAIVDAALERGHEMTLFNRGQTAADMYPDLETLKGDRDPKEGDGLTALAGRSWDAVIDTSGYIPRAVAASADLLADHVNQYVFISSISAYADGSKAGITEEDAVGTIEDETVEEVNGETYGPLKALCEQAVTKAMKGRATNIRPGFIVGPLDRALNRFPLWVRRVATRERIACPGGAESVLQLIDSRDIGIFCMDAIEKNIHGVFNAVGPAKPLTAGAYVDALCKGIGTTPERTWIDEPFLAEKELSWTFIPWVPAGGEASGYASVSNAKAVKAGMKFRPVADSARDTHAWLESSGSASTERIAAMMAQGTEDGLLTAWDERDA